MELQTKGVMGPVRFGYAYLASGQEMDAYVEA